MLFEGRVCALATASAADAGPNRDGCVAESDADICRQLGATCGEIETEDACGEARTASCGTCAEPLACVSNQCACVAEDVCAVRDVVCGSLDVSASCPDLGVVDCGSCTNGTCVDDGTCACEPGFVIDGSDTCVDEDECEENAHDCDPNATCTNVPGSFECECDPGWDGDGNTCVSGEAQIAGDARIGSSSATSSIATSDEVGGGVDQLYLAVIALTDVGSKVVSVEGLGLAWSKTAAQCAGNIVNRVEVWAAEGSPPAGDTVTASFDSATPAAILVYQIDGSSGVADPVAANVNGVDGLCDTTPVAAYALPAEVETPNTRLFVGLVASPGDHTPGPGFEELFEGRFAEPSNMAATLSEPLPTGTHDYLGTFDESEEYALVGLEILP